MKRMNSSRVIQLGNFGIQRIANAEVEVVSKKPSQPKGGSKIIHVNAVEEEIKTLEIGTLTFRLPNFLTSKNQKSLVE